MESRLEASKKRKLKSESKEAGTWECIACTYENNAEDFKCAVCETRKGTSTRKPRLTNDIIEQQQFIAKAIVKDEDKRKRERSSLTSQKSFEKTNPLQFKVFANGFEVTITEFKPKTYPTSIPNSPAISNCSSSVQGFMHSDLNQPSPSSSDAASFSHASQPSEAGTSDGNQRPPQARKRGRRKKVIPEPKKEISSACPTTKGPNEPLPPSPLGPSDRNMNIYESPPSSVCSTSETIPDAKKPSIIPSPMMNNSQDLAIKPATTTDVS